MVEVGERLIGIAGCACCISKETSLAVVDALGAEVLGRVLNIAVWAIAVTGVSKEIEKISDTTLGTFLGIVCTSQAGGITIQASGIEYIEELAS